jgi:hypothetical protein
MRRKDREVSDMSIIAEKSKNVMYVDLWARQLS